MRHLHQTLYPTMLRDSPRSKGRKRVRVIQKGPDRKTVSFRYGKICCTQELMSVLMVGTHRIKPANI